MKWFFHPPSRRNRTTLTVAALSWAATAVTTTFTVALARADTPPAESPPPPATQPARQSASRPSTGDDALDFLLGAATDAPATRPAADPATRPANPFANDPDADDQIRTGTLLLSSGEKLRGKLATTTGKPIRVWIEKEKAYHDIAFTSIRSIEAKLLWQRDEKEWRFRESGSDIKEYSGKTYPARELEYTFTLTDGSIVHGGVVAPIHLQTKDGHVTFVLHKRQKGEVGQTTKELVYVQRLELE